MMDEELYEKMDKEGMKQETIPSTIHEFSEFVEYGEGELADIFNLMWRQARGLGYKHITFHFRSHMEEYDDYLGNPSVVAVGWIKKSVEDLRAEARDKEQVALAEKLNCTEYEAGQYMDLREKGIIK